MTYVFVRERVLLAMRDIGVSQEALAANAGLSKKTVYNLLKGKPVSLATAQKIAEALRKPRTELIEESPVTGTRLASPFHRHLGAEIDKAVPEAARERSQCTETGKGKQDYKRIIRKYLREFSLEPEPEILALCGEKPFDEKEADSYFELFYRFAREQDVNGRILVCRIFVENTAEYGADKFSPVTAKVIKAHSDPEQERHGVLGLTIDAEKLADGVPLINDHIRTGFGFVVFHSRRRCVVVAHEGKELDFAVLHHKMNTAAALQMFEFLCETADVPKKHQEVVKRLITRLAPDMLRPV